MKEIKFKGHIFILAESYIYNKWNCINCNSHFYSIEKNFKLTNNNKKYWLSCSEELIKNIIE